MTFASKASKLLTNKYVLYFMLFLAVTNLFGYMVMNKTNAIIFFVLIALVTHHFNKNMVIVLGVALFVTNLLMTGNVLREGLENADTDVADKAVADKAEAAAAVADKKANKPATPPVDINNLDMNNMISSTDVVPESETTNVSGMATMNKKNNKAGRIDYASTLEEAYDNLDKILGPDGMKNLTNDTTKLMTKQQELFDTMKTMTPMLNQAKQMLEGFDMKSLKGLTSLASGFAPNMGAE